MAKKQMYQRTILPNGVNVITHQLSGRDSVAIGLWIKAGGRYENDANKGAAHFLEHMLFKGTKKYSCGEIKEKVEGVGGSLNAFTDEECTCYYAKIPSRYLKQTFGILSDMVLSPLLTKKDTDKERTVILEEIKMYHDLPQYYVFELLEELLWPDHPLGKNLAGTTDSVGKMGYRDLRTFHQTYYSSANIVITGCGDLTHSALVRFAKKTFAKAAKKAPVSFQEASNAQERPKTRFSKRSIEQMHLALGFFGLPYGHKDRAALNLLNVILGGNMSSRLFNEVREKRGLAYSISSTTKSLKDTGVFLIRAGVDNRKVVTAVDVILKELKKTRMRPVTKKELVRAKEYFLGQILLSMEDTLEHMFWLGHCAISLGYLRTLKEIIKETRRVTPADIKRLAGDVFDKRRINLSVVGPISDSQEKELRQLVNR